MNIKYSKQRHANSCGTTAVLNAIKWRNNNISYTEMYKSIAKKCKQTEKGCYYLDILNACRSLGFKAFVRRYPSVDFIREQLLRGKSVIMLYYHPKVPTTGNKHFIFIPEYNQKFTIVNGYDYDNLEKNEQTVMFYDNNKFNTTISKKQRFAIIVLSK